MKETNMSNETRYIPHPAVADAIDLVHALQLLGVPLYETRAECEARNEEWGFGDGVAAITITIRDPQ
jgi:hypothetical protein